MTTARYIIGDTRDVIASLPDQSVDLVLTSPPFLALRSYLPADHPDKAREIGSEATPADFLDVLLDLTEEWARVLAPHGSICVELGDTYSGSGGAGGDYTDTGLRAGQEKFSGSAVQHRRAAVRNRECGRDGGSGWPLSKSLCGIPTLYAWSLAYGRNLLRPERTTDQWRIRNLVAWVRPNPPVGALGDKFRPATSYMTIATKSRNRWFDLDAVREPHKDFLPNGKPSPRSKYPDRQMPGERNKTVKSANTGARNDDGKAYYSGPNPAGAPPLDWWEIPTEPYRGSHYATWPRRLLERPILAMCPLRVCTVCGEPSRRIVRATEYGTAREATGRPDGALGDGHRRDRPSAQPETLGWTDCGCSTDGSHWRNGVVLDPFAGSGTTLAVATGHGRDAIGIDIDERNADLALERIGPLLLTVERFAG